MPGEAEDESGLAVVCRPYSRRSGIIGLTPGEDAGDDWRENRRKDIDILMG